jgi:signal transduction histidine kinase
MAKETAHQFGTPISSLMGWLEMLKGNYSNPDKVLDIADEIENDVEKLSKVTQRFSKIGSIPELKTRVVFEEVKKTTEYFQRRLPQSGKIVDLNVEGDKEVTAQLNPELFGWVIENLIKNALDAIDHKKGQINIIVKDCKTRIEVDVTDNGKGIEMNRRKDVFRPGYSTKRRGWGLGLSLSKRIIEGYHRGKISVKNSAPGEGTTFKIILKKISS